jgi:hypothetical protein
VTNFPPQPQRPDQPQYGPPPAGYPAQQPKKSRKTLWIVLSIIGGLLALCCVGGTIFLVAGGKAVDKAVKEAPSPGETARSAEAKKATAKLGATARDGKFEFTVTKVEHGKAQVGDQYLGKQAQGQFVLVSVTVKNIGSEGKLFDGSSQYAYGDGVRYTHDGVAETYANKDAATFLNTINPGNTVSGVLVFDIPAGKKITKVELHDSPFSGGVTVDVT